MHFSSLLLPRTKEAMALYSQLVANPYVEHQELWSMLGLPDGQRRSFVYRSDVTEQGFEINALCATPLAPSAPWVVRSREYAPALKRGQLLAFTMRINPTYDKRLGNEGVSKRTDMVMERYQAADGEASLETVSQGVARDWLSKREEQGGFKLVEVSASRYTRVTPTKRGVPMGKLALLDIEGLLQASDVEVFREKQALGYGKSKFAGCGLMLLSKPH